MSSPTKKRKANNVQATLDDTHDVSTCCNNNYSGIGASARAEYACGRSDNISSDNHGSEKLIQQTLSHMENMKILMLRMEKKLDKMSSLESRCEELEAKCSSLETKLEPSSQSVKDHHVDKLEDKIDTLSERVQQNHEYSQMMLRNQSWKYSPNVKSYTDFYVDSYDEEDAEYKYLSEAEQELKHMTTQLRNGKLPFPEVVIGNGNGRKGIVFDMNGNFQNDAYDDLLDQLMPHWIQFTAALTQFTPAMKCLPDDCTTYFKLDEVVLKRKQMSLIKRALIGKPFKELSFASNREWDEREERDMTLKSGMLVDDIIDVVESNKSLQKLVIHNNFFVLDNIIRLCHVVHNHPMVELDLRNSISSYDMGDLMLKNLIACKDLKLEKLDMSNNAITSAVCRPLANFLATNPKLKELDISVNFLDDHGGKVLAGGLRRNTKLRKLDISGNIMNRGLDIFRSVVCDEMSLNKVADSNHCCQIEVHEEVPLKINFSEVMRENRGSKIYSLLSSRHRHEVRSNVQDFSKIDVKFLPDMLEAVQRYADVSEEVEDDSEDGSDYKAVVKSISIVYEVMRKWEKVFNLYESAGAAKVTE